MTADDYQKSINTQKENIERQQRGITKLEKDHEEAVTVLHRMEGALHVLETILASAVEDEKHKMDTALQDRKRTRKPRKPPDVTEMNPAPPGPDK